MLLQLVSDDSINWVENKQAGDENCDDSQHVNQKMIEPPLVRNLQKIFSIDNKNS